MKTIWIELYEKTFFIVVDFGNGRLNLRPGPWTKDHGTLFDMNIEKYKEDFNVNRLIPYNEITSILYDIQLDEVNDEIFRD